MNTESWKLIHSGFTRAREMRMARGTAMERPCYQTATCTSVNIVTGSDMVKVSTHSKTVPDITVIGDTDKNTAKGSFGTLTERDTKGNGNTTRNTASEHITTQTMTSTKARGRRTFATIWERICTLIQGRNLWPYGRGCFTFDNVCMQHGHYVHVRDPAFDGSTSIIEETDDDDKKSALKEGLSPKMGVRPMWRARCITPYNPEFLPPEAMPLREEVSAESSIDKGEGDVWPKIEEYSNYPEDYREEHYQGEASSRIDNP